MKTVVRRSKVTKAIALQQKVDNAEEAVTKAQDRADKARVSYSQYISELTDDELNLVKKLVEETANSS